MERDTPHGCFVQKLWPKIVSKHPRVPSRKTSPYPYLKEVRKIIDFKSAFFGKRKTGWWFETFFFSPLFGERIQFD